MGALLDLQGRGLSGPSALYGPAVAALQVGNRSVEPGQAQRWLDEHIASSLNGWAHYDQYDSRTGPDELGETDLLAPGLLNVGITLAQFPALKRRLPTLRKALLAVPADAGLVADSNLPELRLAGDDDIRAAADAFAILDEDRPFGTRLTTLTKVLHRKRPQLLPLYDRNVRRCYCLDHDGSPARIEENEDRTHSAFVTLLLTAMSKDLTSREWGALVRPKGMSLLRCLDIVAWHVGQGQGDGP